MITFLKNIVKRLYPFNRYEEYIKWREVQLSELRGEFDTVIKHKNELQEVIKNAGNPYAYLPLGHYYSPFPPIDEIRENEDKIFGEPPRNLPAINLNEEKQLSLLHELKDYYNSFPFKVELEPGWRFCLGNPSYSYSDAVFLYLMIMRLKPKRIIEVGCGYSSCEILDINEKYFDNSIDCTFIDPFPELMLSLLKPGDSERSKIIHSKLQEVDLSEFSGLEEKDILFIDSTHVSKVYSDVNYTFFEILPSLKSGVYINFHDIFFPFEYPKVWIYERRAWSESYLMRAFLQYNESFEIAMFNSMMERYYKEFFENNMPLCTQGGGQSIWIRKC